MSTKYPILRCDVTQCWNHLLHQWKTNTSKYQKYGTWYKGSGQCDFREEAQDSVTSRKRLSTM